MNLQTVTLGVTQQVPCWHVTTEWPMCLSTKRAHHDRPGSPCSEDRTWNEGHAHMSPVRWRVGTNAATGR